MRARVGTYMHTQKRICTRMGACTYRHTHTGIDACIPLRSQLFPSLEKTKIHRRTEEVRASPSPVPAPHSTSPHPHIYSGEHYAILSYILPLTPHVTLTLFSPTFSPPPSPCTKACLFVHTYTKHTNNTKAYRCTYICGCPHAPLYWQLTYARDHTKEDGKLFGIQMEVCPIPPPALAQLTHIYTHTHRFIHPYVCTPINTLLYIPVR